LPTNYKAVNPHKENKEEVQDVESRGFLMDLIEDTLTVLGLPHWEVAESLPNVVDTHFSNMAFPTIISE